MIYGGGSVTDVVHIRKFRPYPRIVPRDFIRGIKEDLHNTIPTQETSPDPRALINNHLIQVIEEPNQYDGPPNFNIKDVQDKIPIQETSPDPRAVIYSYYPIQEEPNRYDGPPNFLFFWRNIKDKPPSIGGYKERLMKAFKNILCCCIYRADVHYKRSKQETSPDPRAVIYSNCPIQEEPNRYDGPPNFIFFRRNIKAFENILCCCIYRADEIEDNSVYVLVKKDKKIKPFGEGTYMNFPDGIEQDKFVFVPIKKNNQCNPIGAGANIDFPDFQYNKEEMGDEIKEGNSVYVLMKKNKKMNPFGAGTYMDVPDGIEQDEFVFVPIKKNNQCNPIGENIDFPEELLNFPIQETGLVSVPKINEIDA
ncbi:uncharacterized protein LOC143786169 [Ranitomeya variabilis]|uniref:uncharacterized protein LOC143786169 n=1 Tax=Ranitomeya variabilis TaxID=490064 RepID=UPI004055E6A0